MGAIRSTPTAWFQAWWGITVLLTWLLNISTSADVLMCVISAMIASMLICGSFMAKRPIVAWDPESLMVNVGFGHRRIRWADVDSVTVRRVTQRIYFVLPVSSRMELTIIVRGALFGHKTIRVPVRHLALGPQGFGPLDQAFNASRAAPTRSSGQAAIPNYHAEPKPSDGSPFDADAAIARYLANRSSEPEPIASRPPAAPPRQPVSELPPRRQFGRRTG